MTSRDSELDPQGRDAAIRSLLPPDWSSAWGEEDHAWMRARDRATKAVTAYLAALPETEPVAKEPRAYAAVIEECAQVADQFTCGACGADGKAAAAIRALATPQTSRFIEDAPWSGSVAVLSQPHSEKASIDKHAIRVSHACPGFVADPSGSAKCASCGARRADHEAEPHNG